MFVYIFGTFLGRQSCHLQTETVLFFYSPIHMPSVSLPYHIAGARNSHAGLNEQREETSLSCTGLELGLGGRKLWAFFFFFQMFFIKFR